MTSRNSPFRSPNTFLWKLRPRPDSSGMKHGWTSFNKLLQRARSPDLSCSLSLFTVIPSTAVVQHRLNTHYKKYLCRVCYGEQDRSFVCCSRYLHRGRLGLCTIAAVKDAKSRIDRSAD